MTQRSFSWLGKTFEYSHLSYLLINFSRTIKTIEISLEHLRMYLLNYLRETFLHSMVDLFIQSSFQFSATPVLKMCSGQKLSFPLFILVYKHKIKVILCVFTNYSSMFFTKEYPGPPCPLVPSSSVF